MLNYLEKELAIILIENVEKKQMNITYKEAAEELGKRIGQTVNAHFGLRKPLESIAIACAELGLPIITVRVVRGAGASQKMAGEGFYKIACELKPQYRTMTDVDVWSTEQKLVRECKDWDRLRDYIKKSK